MCQASSRLVHSFGHVVLLAKLPSPSPHPWQHSVAVELELKVPACPLSCQQPQWEKVSPVRQPEVMPAGVIIPERVLSG